MQAPNPRWRVEQLPVPEIRQRIDEVHRFLVERFLPQLEPEEEAKFDYAELSRLTGKLDALGERLLYGYFGPDQLRAVQEALDDIHAIVDLQLAPDLERQPAFPAESIGAPKIDQTATGAPAY